MSETTRALHNAFEPHPNPHQLTGSNSPDSTSKDIDYEPYPEKSVETTAEHQAIIKHITNLYSASASEDDMQVYAPKAIFEDPFSYCDTRHKIAGQWYGIPMVFSESKTLKIEVVSDKPEEIVFKLRQEYTTKAIHLTKSVDILVALSLDNNGKIRYHKDMWNSKDYSHEGIGKIFKTLNGDHLTKITQPPDSL